MLVLQPPTLICFVNRWHQDSSSSRGRWCWWWAALSPYCSIKPPTPFKLPQIALRGLKQHGQHSLKLPHFPQL